MKKILSIIIIALFAISFTACETEEMKDALYTIAENDITIYLRENKLECITTKAESKKNIYMSDIYYKIAENATTKEFKQQFLDSANIYKTKPNNLLGVSIKCLTKYYDTKYSIWDTTHYYVFYYNNKKFVYHFDCDLDNFIKENYIFKK